MTAKLLSAYGYNGDETNLPVADVDATIPYYVEKMGFAVVGKGAAPIKRIVLERDGVQMGLAENGRDPGQEGCAFHTDDIDGLHAEFAAKNVEKLGELKDEITERGSRTRIFFVVAPDGLCYWFGQQQ